MESGFGAPVYQEEPGVATPEAHDASAVQAVDLDDPQLTSEIITDQVDKDAYAVPPPAPDGKWRAKLKQVPIKDADGTMKPVIAASSPNMANGRKFLATNVEVSLLDASGKYDGSRITEYWVKSLVDERKGTSQMSTIATKAGNPPPAASSDRMRYDALAKALAGEPEVIVETYWNAACQTCEEGAKKRGERRPKDFLRGMHRFPLSKDGSRDPNVQCPNCKSLVRAQVRIAQFFSVRDVKATQGLGGGPRG
jgi:hypothetical protein